MSVVERLRRQLLKEELANMPSYMTMSREDASEVLSSFGAIFSSIINSVKLIGQTISLNLKVIANSFKGDQAAIKKNFEDFSVKRDEIHASMKDDLKYFRKAVGDSPLEKGIVASVAFAANPLLLISMVSGPGDIMGSNNSDSAPQQKKDKAAERPAQQSKQPSTRLKAAMQFFGYTSDQNLNEAAPAAQTVTSTNAGTPAVSAQAPTQSTLSKEQQTAAARLQQKSKEFFALQINRANQLMSSMVPQIEAVRAVLRAEDYQQLATAAASPALKNLGINVGSIAGLEKTISAELQKKQEEDPEKFAEGAAELKKKFPSLQAENDVDLLKKVAFSSVKAPAQQNLLKMMEERSQMVLKSMELPLDPKTKSLLAQTPEGKQYVSVMEDLQRKVEGFSQQIKK
jgi:hypothetical protein